MDISEITTKLNQSPERGAIKQTGQGYDYLEAGYVKRKANEIFGPLGWTYTVVELRKVNAGTTSKNKTFVEMLAVVALTVHLDEGARTYEEAGGATSYESEAEINASKAAITQGVKRCLANLGPAFGLELYEGDEPPQRGSNRPNSGGRGNTNRAPRNGAPQRARGSRGNSQPRNGSSGNRSSGNGQAQATAQRDQKVNDGQIRAIKKLAKTNYDMSESEVRAQLGVESLEDLSYERAAETISNMR